MTRTDLTPADAAEPLRPLEYRLRRVEQQLAALQRRAARPGTLPRQPATPLSAAPPLHLRRTPAGTLLAAAPQDLQALVVLTGDLALGGQAPARILAYDGQAWRDADTREIVVHDAIGTFQGRAGDRALVKFHRQSGLWLVWQLRC